MSVDCVNRALESLEWTGEVKIKDPHVLVTVKAVLETYGQSYVDYTDPDDPNLTVIYIGLDHIETQPGNEADVK